MRDQGFMAGPICHGIGCLGFGLRRCRFRLLSGGALRNQ